MAITTGLALGLGLASSIGTQALAARNASKASKDAAKMQTQAADRAMARMDQVWAPYLAHGQQAIGTLGRLTAAPAGSRYAAPPLTPPQWAQPGPPAGSRPRPAGAPSQGAPMPRTFGAMVPPDAPTTVRLRAPDGSVEDVPAEDARRFIALGAQPVN